MIGATAKPVFGRVFIRAAKQDYDTFDPTIFEPDFEIAFPTVTTEYKDGAGEAEYAESPEAGYTSAGGDLVQSASSLPGELKLTGLNQAAIKTFITEFMNKQVDFCIKNDCGGAAGLGDGIIFRNVNIWGGNSITVNGVAMYSVQWQKKYPANCQFKYIQHFEIAAPVYE